MTPREIDALVAEKVMGCKLYRELDYGVDGNYRFRCDCDGPHGSDTPHSDDFIRHSIKSYSTDISAAWEVVEKFKSENKSVTVDGGLYVDGYRFSAEMGHSWTIADSAPMAICLAALKSVGVEV